MVDYPIPDAALDDRLGWVGTAGSGKTYNSGAGVERVLASGGRVIIPDPLGVWFGLALSVDGLTPSAWREQGKLVIFGGEHGDLPLSEHAGALIGETVAKMAESVILDLSDFGTKAGERRFMLAFLTALYRHASGEPVHLVFDEADMWAPQTVRDREGDANKLLGMMETVVRRGRAKKGFIPWLISQRPAVLNKDVLSMVDGIVTFKLTSSQDRNAVGDWVKGQADVGEWKAIYDALPTMQRGQGLVWVPARGIFETVQFPLKATFDSSSTPTRGERRQHRDLKPLNLEKLKERLASVEQEAKANDPRALKAEVARLTRELAKASRSAPQASNSVPAWPDQRGEVVGLREEAAALRTRCAKQASTLAHVLGSLKHLHNEIDLNLALHGDMRDPPIPKIPAPRAVETRPTPPAGTSRKPDVPSATPPRGARPGFPTSEASSPAKGGASLTGPQRQLLEGLAWWAGMGHREPTRTQLAAKVGWRPGGSNLRGRLSECSTLGLIEYPGPARVRLTDAGAAAAPAPDLSFTLLDSIRAVLTGPQRLLFEVLLERGETMQRSDLAETVGWEPGGSNIRGRLSEMSSLELIEYPSRGEVRLQDWVTG